MAAQVSPTTCSLSPTARASWGRSACFAYPLYIRSFGAAFTYQDVNTAGADGATFVLQNAPAGISALGLLVGAGFSWATAASRPGFAIRVFNIFRGTTPSASPSAQTASPANPTQQASTPINIASGDPINVTILYANGILQLTLQDTITTGSFSTNLTIDLPTALGADTAYVGFTGGSGATTSTQQISNFAYLPYPTLSAQLNGSGKILLSWPASIGGYNLQTKSDLGVGTWQNSGATITLTNGQNQLQITPTGAANFYQLILP